MGSITLRRHGKGWLLRATQWFGRPIAEVFAFFANAENLEAITPDQLRFNIITPRPIDMHEGQLIDYRLRIRGVPVRWRTNIAAWQPPYRFVDEQLHGPYRWWIHEHTFEPDGGGTLMRDTVRYGVPGGRIIHRLFVQRDVLAIFQHRARVLQQIMRDARAVNAPDELPTAQPFPAGTSPNGSRQGK